MCYTLIREAKDAERSDSVYAQAYYILAKQPLYAIEYSNEVCCTDKYTWRTVMNKIIFKITANNSHHTFDYTNATLDYVFRMYSVEDLNKFNTQSIYCEDQGWVDPVPEYDLDDTESIQNAHSNTTSCVFVDTSTNSFSSVYTGEDLQAFWDWFVMQEENFKPLADHYAANPSEGTLSVTLVTNGFPQQLDAAQIYV